MKILIVIAIFFSFFPVFFIFLPISSRLVIASFGLIILIFTKGRLLSKEFINNSIFVVLAAVSVSIWAAITVGFFNAGDEFVYIDYVATVLIMLLSIFSSFYLIIKQYGKNNISFGLLADYIILAILAQMIISLAIFFIPNFKTFTFNIQILDTGLQEFTSAQLEASARFIGFGVRFYTSGIFAGFALILISFLLKNAKYSFKKVFFYVFAYSIIFIVGFGMARTTVIGFVLSILILILPSSHVSKLNRWSNTKFVVLSSIIFIVLGALSLSVLSSDNVSKLENVTEFAFELFDNMITKGELKTNSSDGTFEMIKLPKETRTYLVGTGYYEKWISFGDFNYSDTGYTRLLYYFGVLGIILYFIVEILVIYFAFYRFNKLLFYIMLLFLLVLNIKGMSTLIILSLLFYYGNYKQNMIILK